MGSGDGCGTRSGHRRQLQTGVPSGPRAGRQAPAVYRTHVVHPPPPPIRQGRPTAPEMGPATSSRCVTSLRALDTLRPADLYATTCRPPSPQPRTRVGDLGGRAPRADPADPPARAASAPLSDLRP